MTLFTSLTIFSSLVCGAVKEDRNSVVHGCIYTIDFLFFFFLAIYSTKNRIEQETISIYFRYILFLSPKYLRVTKVARVLILDRNNKVAQPVPSLDGNSSHEEIFSRLPSRATLGCKQDQAESFKGNLLVACRFEGFLFHRRRDTRSHGKVHYTSDVRGPFILMVVG